MTIASATTEDASRSRREQVTSVYAIGVGLSMLGLWTGLYLAGEIPELASAPLEIGYHLLAEGVTAVALLAAGVGRWRGRAWADRVLPIALGMLFYTVINSAGYYAQLSEWPMVGLFTTLTLLTGLFLVAFLRGWIRPDRRPAEATHGGELRV